MKGWGITTSISTKITCISISNAPHKSNGEGLRVMHWQYYLYDIPQSLKLCQHWSQS